MTDPFYFTAEWKMARRIRLEMDDFTCTVPHCGEPATVVDHIISRRQGGSDDVSNLRSLCSLHDRQIKENPRSREYRRGRGGKVPIPCDVNGYPLDPRHPWYRGGK
jgi:5-methylcytosine-specific restriction endonuclease McrA